MNLERHGDVALLRLGAGKANAINPEFLRALNARLDEVLATSARALVVTGNGAFFSAGLDLPALVDLDRPAMAAFMNEFEGTMQRLFELAVPVVAAIDGHAIAGGCIVALQADVRVMADKPVRIGLNEAQLGLALPPVVLETLRCQVPATSFVAITMEGGLFLPAEAQRLGLVHEVVAAEALLDRALARAKAFAALPPAGVRRIKADLRRPVSAVLNAIPAQAKADWVDLWFSEGTQAGVRAAVEKLRKK